MGDFRCRRGVAVLLALCFAVMAGCGGGAAAHNGSGEPADKKAVVETVEPAETAMAAADAEAAAPDDAPADNGERNKAGMDRLRYDRDMDGMLVGVCLYSLDNSYMTSYMDEMLRVFGDGAAEVTVLDAAFDQARQLEQIHTMITYGVDVLIVNIVTPDVVPMVADLCNDAGIPVVFVNRRPADDEIERWALEEIFAAYVGVDPAQAGYLQGALVAALPGGGDVDGDGAVRYAVLTGDPAFVEAQLRTNFAELAMLDAGLNIDCLYEGSAGWSGEEAMTVAENVLAAFRGDVDVILCNNDDMALGALQAVMAAGLVPGEDIHVLGIDGVGAALEAVRDGTLSGTVLDDPRQHARTAVAVAAAMVYGDPVDHYYQVDYRAVVRDNAAEAIAETEGR